MSNKCDLCISLIVRDIIEFVFQPMEDSDCSFQNVPNVKT